MQEVSKIGKYMRTRRVMAGAGLLLITGLLFTGKAQHLEKHFHTRHMDSIVCYYSTTPHEVYIPPPEAYLSRLKSGQEAGATFNITIINAPSQDAFAAAEMAADIWGSLIYSPVPINVKIEFADQDEGTLASTGTPWPPYILDENGYLPERIYIQALAEKFYGINMNGDNPDMSIYYNQNIPWYFGTDSLTPKNTYDFLSTVLHEMAHGLGFYGYFYVDDDGMGDGLPIPAAFDGFFENSTGQRLSDTILFPQPSEKLGDALTRPPVYFDSPIVARELPEETMPPKMFIPNPWRPGNSLYHLDQIYDYTNGERDALMTYSTGTGKAIHDPGPITTYMLYEIGWVHTYIQLDTLKDRETLGDPFSVVAKIYGDKGIKPSSQFLFYSFNGFQTVDSVAMSPTGTPDEFKADIPVSQLNTTVCYYVKTQDSYDRVYTMPAEAPKFYYRFYVGTDNTPPSIEHMPIQYMLLSNDSVAVRAEISDNLGLDVTQVEYKINDVDQAAFDLAFDTLSDYRGYFVFTEGQLSTDDIIKYRIKAVDGSAAQNTTYHPETGYHEFKVEDLPEFVDLYTNDFESGLNDFGLNGFSLQKPDGFSSFGIHTDHPYPAYNRDNAYMELEATLKVPIRLNPGDMAMRFDEIAYIEEGESNSRFGDWNFWDYVVVEGSKDGGNTWHRFEDGWDCRFQQVWSDHFTDLQYQERYLSTAVPDESAMRTHVLDLLAPEEFDGNDVIIIRFRLYSDPYFAGWGWAIDNLEIGPSVSSKELAFIPDAIGLYPNPTSGMLNVSIRMNREPEKLEIRLFDLLGQEILVESYRDPGLTFSQYFDLSGLSNGVYLMKFTSGSQSAMKKIILAR